MVAINTTHNPAEGGYTGTREANLQQWLKRTQEVLAHRSLQGLSFHRLFNLIRTKRLIELALDKVLRNDGAKTAGVDGVTRKHLEADNGNRRRQLIDELWKELCAKAYRPSPVRRVYIPKPNGDRRPLGIPTIKDRVVQEMLRLILEPIYEAKFYGHSYGFRPYRATHHAAARVRDLMGRRGFTIAIEGDIRKCFDRIHHEKLVSILRRTIKDERIIKLVRQMLAAGVMEDGAWQATDAGTPQGGIVSPLLANIYLNELDQFIRAKWHGLTVSERHRRRRTAPACYIVRYADDFIVAVQGTLEQAQVLKDEIAAFLDRELHLELSAEKTLVTPVEQGFDFLGFHIRKYPGGQVLITPSRKAIARFKDKVRDIAKQVLRVDLVAGIIRLNRFLSGWANYYRRVSSSRAFKHLDNFVWTRVWKTTFRVQRFRDTTASQHFRRHYIHYRYDLKRAHRWRSGGHYGVWADNAQTKANIIIKLGFFPIRYVDFFPSDLNPYVPMHRYLLDQKKGLKLKEFLSEIQQDEQRYEAAHGAEWEGRRREILSQAANICERCGSLLWGRRATVHHRVPRREAKTRRQANKLENLTALCPKCHDQADREYRQRKRAGRTGNKRA